MLLVGQILLKKGIHPFYIGMDWDALFTAMVDFTIESHDVHEDHIYRYLTATKMIEEKKFSFTLTFSGDDYFLGSINSNYVFDSEGREICGQTYFDSPLGKKYNLREWELKDDSQFMENMRKRGYYTFENDDEGLSVFVSDGIIETVTVYDGQY